jgi:hypothetical protein
MSLKKLISIFSIVSLASYQSSRFKIHLEKWDIILFGNLVVLLI